MNARTKFWILYILFAVLNLVDYYSTAVCFLLPGFEEQNPIVATALTGGIGLFLEMKLSIIFFAGTVGGLVYQIGKERSLMQFNRGLIVLNAVLAIVCSANIAQLIIYFTA